MDTPQSPVEQFRTYAFETDPAYQVNSQFPRAPDCITYMPFYPQTGLQSMIATGALEGKDKEEETEWLFSTKLFYFNRYASVICAKDEADHSQNHRSIFNG